MTTAQERAQAVAERLRDHADEERVEGYPEHAADLLAAAALIEAAQKMATGTLRRWAGKPVDECALCHASWLRGGREIHAPECVVKSWTAARDRLARGE